MPAPGHWPATGAAASHSHADTMADAFIGSGHWPAARGVGNGSPAACQPAVSAPGLWPAAGVGSCLPSSLGCCCLLAPSGTHLCSEGCPWRLQGSSVAAASQRPVWGYPRPGQCHWTSHSSSEGASSQRPTWGTGPRGRAGSCGGSAAALPRACCRGCRAGSAPRPACTGEAASGASCPGSFAPTGTGCCRLSFTSQHDNMISEPLPCVTSCTL